jgi:fermentation-respiration switch protein FrsA (DUF1100 family)
VNETSATLDRGERVVRLLRLAPAAGPDRAGPRPAWILLHGITRPGIHHPVFKRFARALAASGAVVYLPEVPEWIGLELAPEVTTPTVEATLRRLDDDPGVQGDRVGLMGFSFGAPQALVTAGAPSVAGRLAAVAGFGAYCDLESTLRFLFTGEFESAKGRRRVRPDPYGRWIVAANYLTCVPDFEDAEDVARALRELAASAGDARVPSWDPRYDADKGRLRRTVASKRRALFDRFAPPAARDPLPRDDETLEWVARLASAAREVQPLVEPLAHIGTLPPSLHLLHGRDDILIPYPQTERLAEALRDWRPHLAVTGLFAHSGEADGGGRLARLQEGVRFGRALARVLGAL